MAIDRKYNNLTRKSVVIPAYSVATVEYNDSMPNYYRVMNMGEGKLYCGTSAIPTTHRFEFSVGPQKIKLYTEPSRRNNLYIYNPSGVDVGCQIVSFEAEFDPATLALSDLEMDVSGQTVQSESVITGFNQPLPQGNNKIGNVGISGALPAGTNNIGKVDIASALPAGANNIGKVTVANQVDYAEDIVYIRDAVKMLENVSRKYCHFKSGTATSAGITYNTSATICHIAFLSNDGEDDLTLTAIESDGTTNSIVIKAGEVLNHIECTLTSIKVSGADVPFRLIYNERNGG